MIHDLRTFCLGLAAVLSTALLLTLVDRRNWRYLDAAVLLLIFAGWLFYAGSFLNWLLRGSAGPWIAPLQSLTSIAMAGGIALMPSALLHSVLRMRPPTRRVPLARHAYLYLPVLCMIPACRWLWRNPAGEFVVTLRPLVIPFVVWMIIASLVSAAALLRFRRGYTDAIYRRSATWIAVSLMVVAALLALAFGGFHQQQLVEREWLAALLPLPPMIPGFVFAYLIIRYGFMRLMLEQTMVYGAIVMAGLLLHQLTIGRLTASLQHRFGIDFAIVEAGLVAVLLFAYGPIR